MHALIINFTSAASPEELAEPFEQYARALESVPGFVMKTWLRDDATLGGFHLFETRGDADRYLAGELCATVLNNPAFSDFTVRHFDVLERLSAITHSPTAAATAST